MENIINTKLFNDFDELDKMEIFATYSALYPNSSTQPSLEDAVQKIKDAVEYMNIKYVNKRR